MRQMPYNKEAEQTLLGQILCNQNVLTEIRIKPEIFYRTEHQAIAEAILEAVKRNEDINIVSVCERLTASGKLEDVGGRAYVNDLAMNTITTTNCWYFYSLVLEKYNLRKIIAYADNLSQQAYEGEEKPESLLTIANDVLYSLNITKEDKDGRFLEDILNKNYEDISDRYTHYSTTGEIIFPNCIQISDAKPKLKGFLEGGYRNEELHFFAAKSGAGKTAFINDIILDIAGNPDNKNTPVAFFQLEMSSAAIGNRALSNLSKVRKSYFKYVNNLQDFHFTELVGAINKVSQMNKIKIFDNPDFTIPEIEYQAKRFFSKYGKGIVFIDNLQILNHDLNNRSDTSIVDYLTRKLKAMAKRLQAPVICLTQLTKEAFDNSEPELKDVRGSGQIIANADIILLLHNTRDDEKNPTAKIIIGKNRDGICNARIEYTFDMTTGRFIEK